MQALNIAIIISSVLLNAMAQLLLKKSVENKALLNILASKPLELMLNPFLLGGMLSYAFSIIIWLYVLSKNPVSFSYPFLSIGYIFVTICGHYFFNEKITTFHILGLGCIILGIILISQ